NGTRGYVLRRLLRRIIRSSRLLGVREPVLGEFSKVVRDAMAPSYPELVTEFDRIESVMNKEEEAFLATLSAGSRIFDLAVKETKKAGKKQLSGDKAFQLHDTYGFPIDLTLEMAAEQGLSVDEEGFRNLMAEQRRRAKEDAKARKTGHGDLSTYRALLDEHGTTEFIGYTDLQSHSRVLGILVNGQPARTASAGTEVELVLDRTPFYAEGGGQIADTGRLVGPGVAVGVGDVPRAVPGV
ncbi:alanine--tRNA ligase, partial [Klebsiella pneumoniae]|nr:alanine--tRNA ligase [Klebsiella pneumoniae]